MISIFLKNYVEKKGKNSNLSLEESKKKIKQMIARSKGKEIFIGRLHLGKQLNKDIPVFIKETGSGGTYYQDSEEYIEHIVIAFDTIFSNLENILSILAHEVIHAIQQYKKYSPKYGIATSKIINKEPMTPEEDFWYYTEPSEFEANASQLAYIITRFYERKDVNKEKVLFVLDNVLKFPQKRMHKFFNSFYIRYLMNLPDEEQELLTSYLREMFLHKLQFLKSIAIPPSNKPIYIKKSNRYWRQFKQKLFTLTQNLKKRYLKKQEKSK